jgi:hypothetical protein
MPGLGAGILMAIATTRLINGLGTEEVADATRSFQRRRVWIPELKPG